MVLGFHNSGCLGVPTCLVICADQVFEPRRALSMVGSVEFEKFEGSGGKDYSAPMVTGGGQVQPGASP